jgi:hypothetical protein
MALLSRNVKSSSILRPLNSGLYVKAIKFLIPKITITEPITRRGTPKSFWSLPDITPNCQNKTSSVFGKPATNNRKVCNDSLRSGDGNYNGEKHGNAIDSRHVHKEAHYKCHQTSYHIAYSNYLLKWVFITHVASYRDEKTIDEG